MPQGLNYGRPSGTCKEIPALRILSANACLQQLTNRYALPVSRDIDNVTFWVH